MNPRRIPLLVLVLGAALAPALGQDQSPPPASPSKPPAPAAQDQPEPKPAAAQVAPHPLLAHVEVRGTGPIPMILIPAFVCDWSVYDAFMTRNADRYTMYAITLPGFGKSDPPPAPPDDVPYSVAPWLESAVRGILQLIDDRHLDKPVVLGVSTGGHVALRVAIAAPEKIRAAATLNGLPAIPLHNTTVLPQVTRDRIIRDEYAAYWKACPADEWARQQQEWIHVSFPDPERAKAVLAAAADTPKSSSGRYMLEYFASDVSDKLSSLNVPVLAISSLPRPTDPQFQALKDSWKAAFAKLPQAKIAFFETSGEFITEDSPAELDRSLQQFLEGKAVDGKGAVQTGLLPAPPNSTPPPTTPEPAPAKPAEPK